MEFREVTALVTGAASGLGAATAGKLAAAGASVVGLDLPHAVERAATPPGGVQFVGGDVTIEEDVLRALGVVDETGRSLRIVVNCAGILPFGRILSRNGPHDLETFRKALEVNVLGTFNVMRLAAELMSRNEPGPEGERGVIVDTASVAAFEGQVGQIAYAASKAGVAGMTICAARDLAQFGIRVNAIAPGVVDTPMLATLNDEFRAALRASVPFPSRLAKPEEFADLVIVIAQNDYLNGETIRLDGALRMAPR